MIKGVLLARVRNWSLDFRDTDTKNLNLKFADSNLSVKSSIDMLRPRLFKSNVGGPYM